MLKEVWLPVKYKCVFAVGPESSGSMLVARILAHVLKIEPYGLWNGVGWNDSGRHKICHRSLPFGMPPHYPNIDQWIRNNRENYDLYFVLTTRDISLSESSRMSRFMKPKKQVEYESIMARQMMSDIIKRDVNLFVWSYETFMFLEIDYLRMLYRFIGIDSDFSPDLVDGNSKWIQALQA